MHAWVSFMCILLSGYELYIPGGGPQGPRFKTNILTCMAISIDYDNKNKMIVLSVMVVSYLISEIK